jgi:hypothetical protein
MGKLLLDIASSIYPRSVIHCFSIKSVPFAKRRPSGANAIPLATLMILCAKIAELSPRDANFNGIATSHVLYPHINRLAGRESSVVGR